jgi:NAD(P)-dependent dehydrogenase (short-subunit alcohol dehydrogenase family)
MTNTFQQAGDPEKTIVITGSTKRLGKEIALAVAEAGYSVIIHTSRSIPDAKNLVSQINGNGGDAKFISANFLDPREALKVFSDAFNNETSLYGLINNASIFEPGLFMETTRESWESHFSINLTTPFLISKEFARCVGEKKGRIINMLDWRALRPGKDHFAYTISKSGLAAMTEAMALALAPNITVNGLALGAILPPLDGGSGSILKQVPQGRWASIEEVTDSVLFLLSGPEYITGEIIHIDGGRHLV